MVSGTDLSTKIADPELRGFASRSEEERRLVLVEPDLPARGLRMERPDRGSLPARPIGAEPEEAEEASARTTAARRFLSDLLHREPRWLATARTFLVEATGPEIAEMAHSPLIKAIHPNRSLR